MKALLAFLLSLMLLAIPAQAQPHQPSPRPPQPRQTLTAAADLHPGSGAEHHDPVPRHVADLHAERGNHLPSIPERDCV